MLTTIELAPLLLGGGARARVSGASGIVRAGSWLHVVSDDDQHVYSWRVPLVGVAVATRCAPGELPIEPDARKAAKADIEALFVLRGGGSSILVGLGSGSTARRRHGFAVVLGVDGDIHGDVSRFDAGGLLEALVVDGEPPNVEGAAQLDDVVMLALRSSAGANRLARIDATRLHAAIVGGGEIDGRVLADIVDCELDQLGGVPLGLTDLAALDGELWFTAAAEDTDNAYDDGAVVGSVVGQLDLAGRVVASWRIGLAGAKVEGLALHPAPGAAPELWLVTDGDDEARPSLLLSCPLPHR